MIAEDDTVSKPQAMQKHPLDTIFSTATLSIRHESRGWFPEHKRRSIPRPPRWHHRDLDASITSDGDGFWVAGIHVADNAHARIIG